ncbi:MAG: T9SS type A sorting domain-containing protein, partial [Bacteroidales bacterium]|nr:T9SS type A sorting domain-containing protein [Bacteroidales bacterium]
SLSGKYTFEIYAIEGRKLSTSRHFLPTGASNIAVEMPYSAGIYLLRCIDPKGRGVTRKIVIN